LWDTVSQDIYNNADGFDKLQVIQEFSSHMKDGLMVSHDNEAGAAKLIKHTGHDMMIAAKHVTKQLNERDHWLVFGSLCLSKIDRQDVDYNVVSEFREAAINYEK